MRGYLYNTYVASSVRPGKSFLGPLHVRRTLDQSHYFMLVDTSERNVHQVVLREARKQLKQKEALERQRMLDDTTPAPGSDLQPEDKEEEEYQMVMVDQLWLWVIGDKVITSFPQKWTRHNDILERLRLHLSTDKKRTPIRKAQDLVDIIIKFTIGVFNRPRTTPGLGLHDFFEAAVGSVADREIDFFQKFEHDVDDDPTIPDEDRMVKEKLDAIYRITDEVELMRETKDIRDVLRMMLHIINDQALVIADMNKILDSPLIPTTPISAHSPPGRFRKGMRQKLSRIVHPEQQSPHQVITTVAEGDTDAPTRADILTVNEKDQHTFIVANTRGFNRMLGHANASYEALNHLLDLKQKSANATEARFARKGAEESAKQGNIIMFLTIVTIIFGSLSFVTAFFALNVSAFPPGKDPSTAWTLGHIVDYVVDISVGLALPLVLIAFTINPVLEMSE